MECDLIRGFHFRRISCRFKFQTVVKVGIVVFFLLTMTTETSASNKRDKAAHVYEGKAPKDEAKRISIIIGDDDDDLKRERDMGIFEEDSGGGSGNSTGGVAASTSTTWDKCEGGSRCCYQYTWPGYRENIPAPANATCEYLQKEMRDNTFACFDPLVFTEPIAGESARWTPPDFQELVNRAQANNWNIYCPMADKNCITYTYYSRDENKRVANQTKFCGIVTDSNTGNRIRDGCYRQNMIGYIREVCVYTRSLGNRSGASSMVRLSRSHNILWYSIFLVTTLSSTLTRCIFSAAR